MQINLFGDGYVSEPRIVTLLSLGMGVESVSVLLQWDQNPELCPCPLEDVIVVTAQLGSEYADTKRNMEQFILPIMRRRRMRYVQVARAGPSFTDGIIVLDDTREPYICYTDGAYKLADEMALNGTVPQYGPKHVCAQKHKAWTIEEWINANIQGVVLKHAIGYNADEGERVQSGEYANEERERKRRNRKPQQRTHRTRIAFGFNCDEKNRISTSGEYNTFSREAFYPLLEWGWDRQSCIDYIESVLGITWRRSACVFCPFLNLKKENAVERQIEHAEQMTEALVMEYTSLCFNPRGALYKKHSLIDHSKENNPKAIEFLNKKLAAMTWGVYRVRRIYYARTDKDTGEVDESKKGTARRCVEKLSVYASQFDALAALTKFNTAGLAVNKDDIHRIWIQTRSEVLFPTREEFYVVAPATVETKAMGGVLNFNRKWERNWLFKEEDVA